MIYRLKIAQRILGKNSSSIDYFPFDRAYLVLKEDQEILPRVFPCYFHMQLTAKFWSALKVLDIDAATNESVARSSCHVPDTASRKRYHWPQNIKQKITDSVDDWLLVAPTHLSGIYDTYTRRYTKRVVQYLVTRAITLPSHNETASFPRIALHTPNMEYPMACVACERYDAYLAGECSFATQDCRTKSLLVQRVTEEENK